MSKMALRNSPRFSLLAMMVLILSIAVAGCGGGGGSSSGNNNSGGGNNNNGGGGSGGTTTPGTAIVAGRVVDSGNNPVLGAKVTFFVNGTASVSGLTGSNGSFQINNVPTNANSFAVTAPNPDTNYYDEVTYNNVTYNTDPTRVPLCVIPLPTLTANQINSLPSNPILLSGTTQPPPPPGGCG